MVYVSPFEMKVRPTVEPKNVKVTGPGVSSKGVPASIPVDFVIDTSDAGYGDLQVQVLVIAVTFTLNRALERAPKFRWMDARPELLSWTSLDFIWKSKTQLRYLYFRFYAFRVQMATLVKLRWSITEMALLKRLTSPMIVVCIKWMSSMVARRFHTLLSTSKLTLLERYLPMITYLWLNIDVFNLKTLAGRQLPNNRRYPTDFVYRWRILHHGQCKERRKRSRDVPHPFDFRQVRNTLHRAFISL